MTQPLQGTKAEMLAQELYGFGTRLRWRSVAGGSQWWIDSPGLKDGAVAAKTLKQLEKKLTAISRGRTLPFSRPEEPVEGTPVTQQIPDNLITAAQAAEILKSSMAYVYLLKKRGAIRVLAQLPGRGGRSGSRDLYGSDDVRGWLAKHGPIRIHRRGLRRDQTHRAKLNGAGKGHPKQAVVQHDNERTRIARLVTRYNAAGQGAFVATTQSVTRAALQLGLAELERRK